MSTVHFTLDGQAVTAEAGESLLDVAQRCGTELPHLCHKDGLRSPGNCRACVVEVQGERVLAPSCCRSPAEGMVVHTASDRATRARRTVLELLLADAPATVPRSSTTANSPPGPREPRPGPTASRRARRSAMTPRTRPWWSTWTPASSAPAASAPAAKSRATMCWAWLSAGAMRRSCSTRPTPWARAPVWPAANACRPAPPAPSRRRTASSRSRCRSRWIRSARSAAWAASSPTRSATNASSMWWARKGRPTKAGCA